MGLVFVQDQSAMDLIGAYHDIVFFTDGGKSFLFIPSINASHRVMRIAETENPGIGSYRFFKSIKIELPSVVFFQ